MKSLDAAPSRLYHAGTYFEPDILAPFQYSKANRRRDHLHPEEKLMFAVLTDAIECFQKYIKAKSRRCRRIFDEAESWIMNRDCLSLFSFEHICEALHIDPSYLRVGLMRWRAGHDASKYPHRRIREPLRHQYRSRSPRITA